MATDLKIRDLRTKLMEGTVPTHVFTVPQLILILLRTFAAAQLIYKLNLSGHNLKCLVPSLSLQVLI